MKAKPISRPPNRITDLARLKQGGSEVTCRAAFEILPVDFAHRDVQFQAFIFLAIYSGEVDGREFRFRKCYSRGCPHNLCPHVSQAVMIANRYLKRDYRVLKQAGIEIEEGLFTLEDMLVKYADLKESHDPVLAIHDYINIAKEGNPVSVEVCLEYVPAVEHFASYQNAQTFLMGDFAVTVLGKTHPYQRCLACYQTENEAEEKTGAQEVANERLAALYREFDEAAVRYDRRTFE